MEVESGARFADRGGGVDSWLGPTPHVHAVIISGRGARALVPITDGRPFFFAGPFPDKAFVCFRFALDVGAGARAGAVPLLST